MRIPATALLHHEKSGIGGSVRDKSSDSGLLSVTDYEPVPTTRGCHPSERPWSSANTVATSTHHGHHDSTVSMAFNFGSSRCPFISSEAQHPERLQNIAGAPEWLIVLRGGRSPTFPGLLQLGSARMCRSSEPGPTPRRPLADVL